MFWKENLYRLHEAWGGQFIGSLEDGDGDNWYTAISGVLFLSDPEGRVMVNASYNTPPAGDYTIGQTLWTRVTTQAELPRRHTLSLKPVSPVKQKLTARFHRRKAEEDWGSGRWMPEGYTGKTDDPAFGRAVLLHARVRALLEQAREADPAPLPLFLSIEPMEETGTCHEIEVRTNLFPYLWTGLKGWKEEFPSAAQIEHVSLTLLQRLVNTGRAVRDTMRELRI